MRFVDACELYKKEKLVTTTHHNYRKVSGYLERSCEYMGEMECSEITKTTLLDLIIHRKEINPDISNVTLNTYVRYVKAVLREQCNRTVSIKKLRETRKMRRYLDQKTIRKVYRYLDKQDSEEARRNKLMFMMLLDTGLRISELLNVNIHNIDYDQNLILVTKTKSSEDRYVIFTNETKKVLLSFIERNNLKTHIFINFETGKMLHTDSIQTICQRIQEKASIDKSITPHKWRHTFASRFNVNGGNMYALMKLLGHKDLATTQIYLEMSMEDVMIEYKKTHPFTGKFVE